MRRNQACSLEYHPVGVRQYRAVWSTQFSMRSLNLPPPPSLSYHCIELAIGGIQSTILKVIN